MKKYKSRHSQAWLKVVGHAWDNIKGEDRLAWLARAKVHQSWRWHEFDEMLDPIQDQIADAYTKKNPLQWTAKFAPIINVPKFRGVPPKFRVERIIRGALRRMKIEGDYRQFKGRFSVKRKDRNTWVLFDKNVKTRSRWGNLSQMTEDIVYVLIHNSLPVADRR